MSELQRRCDAMGNLGCAVVGGGMSGLYTAWRLLGERQGAPVAVFEAGARTGGRLLTWLPYGSEGGLRAELGGMRIFAQQALVWNLTRQLGLATTPFFVSGPNLLWYLRGQRMAAGDGDAAALRYALDQGERGKGPDTLVRYAIDAVLGSAANRRVCQELLGRERPSDRRDWDTVKPHLTHGERRLWDLGFWNLLTDILSFEGYNYATDGFGYYSLTSNWNAAEAMQLISLDFTENPDYQTLVRGMSALPDALRREVEARGGQVLTGCRLVRFERAGEGDCILHLDGGGEGEALVRTRRLVLAMPRRSIELLQPSPGFDPVRDGRLGRLLASVAPYPALKLFLLYSERWWETARGIVHGRSVCDLPIRQTYYLRPDVCEGLPAGQGPRSGLLMVSYDDARAVDFWKGMELPTSERAAAHDSLRATLSALITQAAAAAPGSGTAAEPPEDFDPPPNMHKAPPMMVRRATEQLALLHGMNPEDIPEPIVGAYADWSLDPLGGAWNFWQAQVDVAAAMRAIQRPLGESWPVFVVGEAYSGLQGWVEGALTTAEVVLQNQFGLPRPAWLPADYYLGW